MSKKIILGFGLLFFATLFYFRPAWFSLSRDGAGPLLRVIFFDVGQGDSALIITPTGKTILVDGGPDNKVLSKLGQSLPFGQKKIDIMILTHPHADHLDGLVWVLGRYQVGEVYYSGAISTTDSFLRWLEIIKEKKIPMKIVDRPEEEDWGGGVKSQFLYPNLSLQSAQDEEVLPRRTPTKSVGAIPSSEQEETQNQPTNSLNNTSIVFKLIYGQTSFLFTGDAETSVEQIILSPPYEGGGRGWLKSNVLKVAHHGSHSSTSDAFLEAAQPQIAVISVGKNNDFGHPHARTLRRLERFGAKILRTDEAGDIEIISNKTEVWKK